MLNKFTIIGIIIGSAISILGASSMVTSLNSPNEIQEDTATFGVGDFDKINFNVNASFKNKANFSWTSITAGQTIITIQNTGDSEFTESYKFELERDPLFFTYSILVIIAGVVIIGFSAGFSARKPKGF